MVVMVVVIVMVVVMMVVINCDTTRDNVNKITNKRNALMVGRVIILSSVKVNLIKPNISFHLSSKILANV